MPTNKDSAAAAAAKSYEEALTDYGKGMGLLRKGDYDTAHNLFAKISSENAGEPELAERAGTYARICESRLQPPAAAPATPAERYESAVLMTNRGELDGAIQLLNEALGQDPTAVNCLYVRASAWALKGSADQAISDLREAIAIDPKIRFQAVNDSDFEKIREEPSFIDIIEPTPAGE